MRVPRLLAIILITVVTFILFYIFVAQPLQVSGSDPIAPYKDKEIVFYEKVSYLIANPSFGDVVIFQINGPLNIGKIVSIQTQDKMTQYWIQQGEKNSSVFRVTKDRIVGRVFYP